MIKKLSEENIRFCSTCMAITKETKGVFCERCLNVSKRLGCTLFLILPHLFTGSYSHQKTSGKIQRPVISRVKRIREKLLTRESTNEYLLKTYSEQPPIPGAGHTAM